MTVCTFISANKKTLRRKVFERNGLWPYVRSGACSRTARGAKPSPKFGRKSLASGYARPFDRSRDLSLGQVENRGVDLLQPLRRERAAVGASHVAEHPLLAIGVDEVHPAR